MLSYKDRKESLFYKIPTMIVDLIIYYGVIVGTVLFLNGPYEYYFGAGAVALLVLSYFFIIRIVLPLQITERGRPLVSVFVRGCEQAFLTWALFSGIVSLVYMPRINFTLLILQLLLSMVLIGFFHLVVLLIIRTIRRSGRNSRSIVLIGADDNQIQILNSIKKGYGVTGYRVQGVFTSLYKDLVPKDVAYLGKVSESVDFLASHSDQIDEVFCSLDPVTDKELVSEIIHFCESNFIKFYYVPAFNGYINHRLAIRQFDRVNVICLHEEPLDNFMAKAYKRFMDILISGLFLITLYPFIWLVCAICIKIADPKGPVLFKQKRTGYGGKEFDCLKFRSMRTSSDADTKQATKGDSRIFPFGAFIRKTSIDELPQFYNVFRGDMSIIGPRPHMIYHTEMYSELISNYMVRHLAKPGITGWAQVNGNRGETKTVDDMRDRVEKDIWYIEHWSPELDLRIFLKTIMQLLHADKQAF